MHTSKSSLTSLDSDSSSIMYSTSVSISNATCSKGDMTSWSNPSQSHGDFHSYCMAQKVKASILQASLITALSEGSILDLQYCIFLRVTMMRRSTMTYMLQENPTMACCLRMRMLLRSLYSKSNSHPSVRSLGSIGRNPMWVVIDGMFTHELAKLIVRAMRNIDIMAFATEHINNMMNDSVNDIAFSVFNFSSFALIT